ncbi:hypothetical protein LTR15_007190 [Elasticomyces elasticus]|nr:hypothetical protein LTR15_007190 [Elasticomyces elasticus]
MAASKFEFTQYTAEHFVESAGAILVNVTTRQICVVQDKASKEWLLPKGRRNCGESRQAAALREAFEETGYQSQLLPLTMRTRAPPVVEVVGQHYSDEIRTHYEACEPFMVTCRQLGGEQGLKLIWWYIAAIDDRVVRQDGEDQFRVELIDFDQAVSQLTFEGDREIVRKAVDLFDGVEHNLAEV